MGSSITNTIDPIHKEKSEMDDEYENVTIRDNTIFTNVKRGKAIYNIVQLGFSYVSIRYWLFIKHFALFVALIHEPPRVF